MTKTAVRTVDGIYSKDAQKAEREGLEFRVSLLRLVGQPTNGLEQLMVEISSDSVSFK